MLNLNYQEALEMVRKNGHSIIQLTEEQQKDKSLALEAVKECGLSLYFLKYFKNDKDVVFEAIKQHGMATEHMGEELKKDLFFINDIIEFNPVLKIFFNYNNFKKIKK